jgi:hypothetical protein
MGANRKETFSCAPFENFYEITPRPRRANHEFAGCVRLDFQPDSLSAILHFRLRFPRGNRKANVYRRTFRMALNITQTGLEYTK